MNSSCRPRMLKTFCQAVSAGVNAATLNLANGSALGGISGGTAAALEASMQSQMPTKRSLGNVPFPSTVVSTTLDSSKQNLETKVLSNQDPMTQSQYLETKVPSTDSCSDPLIEELKSFRLHYEDDYAWFDTALLPTLKKEAAAALASLHERVVQERIELIELIESGKTTFKPLTTLDKSLKGKSPFEIEKVLREDSNVLHGQWSDLSPRMHELHNLHIFIEGKRTGSGSLKAKHIYQSFFPAVGRKLVGGSVKLSGDYVAVRKMFEYLMDALIGVINPLEAGLNELEDLTCYYFHYFPRCLGLAADCLRHLQKSCGETALAEQIARLENIRNEVLAKVPEMQETRHELLQLRAEELKIEKKQERGAATAEMQTRKSDITGRAGALQAALDLQAALEAKRKVEAKSASTIPEEEGAAKDMATYFAARIAIAAQHEDGIYTGELTNSYRPTLVKIKQAALDVLPSKLETNEPKSKQEKNERKRKQRRKQRPAMMTLANEDLPGSPPKILIFPYTFGDK